jgi:hypothetical protein
MYIGKTPTAVPIGTNDLADNIVTASKLASTLDLSSNTITLPSGVGGKVLQVVTATYSTSTDINATSFTDSGITANITPSSSSNKIFISSSFGLFGYINANLPRKFYTQLVRGSTAIAEKQVEIEAGTGSRGINIDALDGNFSCLDSPSTLSETTYKVQGKLDSNANSSILRFCSNSAIATITLMEIAG